MSDTSGKKDDVSSLIVGIVAIAAVIFISPGLAFNWTFGKFQDNSEGLLFASIKDGQTWVISGCVWGLCFFVYRFWRRFCRAWQRFFHHQPEKRTAHPQPQAANSTFVPPPNENDLFGERGERSHEQANDEDDNDTAEEEDDAHEEPDAAFDEENSSNNKDEYSSAGSVEVMTDHSAALILELQGQVTMKEIRSAYRKKIAQYHPDKVGHLGPKLMELAERESKHINAAYEYLEQKYRRG